MPQDYQNSQNYTLIFMSVSLKRIVDGTANQIIIGPQYLQDQVKDYDDKLSVQPTTPEPIALKPTAAEIITAPLTGITQPLFPYNINDGRIKFYKLRKLSCVSIGSVDQITPIKGNTNIAIAGVYYTDYEPLKKETNDVNGDVMINIVDDWHVNSVIDGMKSMSWVKKCCVKIKTEMIIEVVQTYDP
ncbi:MAG: hypothetical protein EZS28_053411, partial [Streblomastix strix]